MASRFTERDTFKCWALLAKVLSYGHTIPFAYGGDADDTYFLSEGVGGWGWHKQSCATTLLDDIRFALFERNLKQVELKLPGICEGPVCDTWTFTFTREGLREAYNYYNDD